MPLRASWYSRLPLTDTAEYMGGTCRISPRKAGSTACRASGDTGAWLSSTRVPVTSPVTRRSPSRKEAWYSLSVSGRNCRALAALPSRRGSTPVARGSKVPVWPIFFSLESLRSTATASKEVKPSGLSSMIMPFIHAPFRAWPRTVLPPCTRGVKAASYSPCSFTKL